MLKVYKKNSWEWVLSVTGIFLMIYSDGHVTGTRLFEKKISQSPGTQESSIASMKHAILSRCCIDIHILSYQYEHTLGHLILSVFLQT